MNANCTHFSFPKPPWTSLGKKIESSCRKALYDYKLLNCKQKERKKIALALSGGKDSLTLLAMLCAISGRGFPDLDIVAIHVMGQFSCGPAIMENHLRTICQNFNVPLVVEESETRLQKKGCYFCSRMRRKILFTTARKLGCDTICFGHHQDDITQTMIMNLLNKGEFDPMLPKVFMRKYGITIIRPLALTQEKDIVTFAKKYNFLKSICQCPYGQTSNRAVAKTLIEDLGNYYPNARTNLSHAIKKYIKKSILDDTMHKLSNNFFL